MAHRVHPGHDLAGTVQVTQVIEAVGGQLVEIRGLGLVGAGMEAIDHDHVMAGRDELVDDRRSDEPGSSGHEHTHVTSEGAYQ